MLFFEYVVLEVPPFNYTILLPIISKYYLVPHSPLCYFQAQLLLVTFFFKELTLRQFFVYFFQPLNPSNGSRTKILESLQTTYQGISAVLSLTLLVFKIYKDNP
jgi:hypothetical protein